MTDNQRQVQILEGLDRLLADERNWCKNRLVTVAPNGQRSFCLVGGVLHTARRLGLPRRDATRAMWALRRTGSMLYLRGFNDRAGTSIHDIRRLVKETLAGLTGETPQGLTAARDTKVDARV